MRPAGLERYDSMIAACPWMCSGPGRIRTPSSVNSAAKSSCDCASVNAAACTTRSRHACSANIRSTAESVTLSLPIATALIDCAILISQPLGKRCRDSLRLLHRRHVTGILDDFQLCRGNGSLHLLMSYQWAPEIVAAAQQQCGTANAW